MDERFPYAKTVGGFQAFETVTNTARVPGLDIPDLEPSLLKVLEDIWGRHELSCVSTPKLYLDDVLVSPDTWTDLLGLVYRKPTLLSNLTSLIHNTILNLSGSIYDRYWQVYDADALASIGVKRSGAVFPDDYNSLPEILSRISFSRKTSLHVEDEFRIAGIIRRNEQYASWAVNNGPPDKPFLFHRIKEESINSLVGGKISLSTLGNTGGNSIIRQEVLAWMPTTWNGVSQSISPVRKYWVACNPIKILDQENGEAFGKRIISFSLRKDKDLGYFMSRTSTGRPLQYYMSTSDGEQPSPSFSSTDVEAPSSSSDSIVAPDGTLIMDEPNRYIQVPTARELYVPVESKNPQPAPWQIIGYTDPEYVMPATGEVPYRRPYYTAFTLNGNQVPILDRMTDISHLLVNGTNILEVEYLGRYGWSDWWILPAITIIDSYNFNEKPWGPRRVISPVVTPTTPPLPPIPQCLPGVLVTSSFYADRPAGEPFASNPGNLSTGAGPSGHPYGSASYNVAGNVHTFSAGLPLSVNCATGTFVGHEFFYANLKLWLLAVDTGNLAEDSQVLANVCPRKFRIELSPDTVYNADRYGRSTIFSYVLRRGGIFDEGSSYYSKYSDADGPRTDQWRKCERSNLMYYDPTANGGVGNSRLVPITSSNISYEATLNCGDSINLFMDVSNTFGFHTDYLPKLDWTWIVTEIP